MTILTLCLWTFEFHKPSTSTWLPTCHGSHHSTQQYHKPLWPPHEMNNLIVNITINSSRQPIHDHLIVKATKMESNSENPSTEDNSNQEVRWLIQNNGKQCQQTQANPPLSLTHTCLCMLTLTLTQTHICTPKHSRTHSHSNLQESMSPSQEEEINKLFDNLPKSTGYQQNPVDTTQQIGKILLCEQKFFLSFLCHKPKLTQILSNFARQRSQKPRRG